MASDVLPVRGYYCLEDLANLLGQHFGQGPAPRNLWPRLQVFQPLLVVGRVFCLVVVISTYPRLFEGRGTFCRVPLQTIAGITVGNHV